MKDWIDEGSLPLVSPLVEVCAQRGVHPTGHPIVEEDDGKTPGNNTRFPVGGEIGSSLGYSPRVVNSVGNSAQSALPSCSEINPGMRISPVSLLEIDTGGERQLSNPKVKQA